MRRATMLCVLVVCGMLWNAGAAAGGDVEAAIDDFMIAEFVGIERARANATARFESDPPLLAALFRKADDEYLRESRPLHIAAQDGDLAEVKTLLEAGADIDAPMTAGGRVMTPLYCAVAFGRQDVMEHLLREGANPDAYGESVLRKAAFLVWSDAVRLLLEHGADPTPNDTDAPVLLAPFFPFLLPPPSCVHETLRLLLEAGADPNAGGYATPLTVAMNRGDQVAVWLLRRFGAVLSDDQQPVEELPVLHQAARDGDLVTIKSLLEDGADINQPDDFGMPPIHFAAEAGQYGTLRWLLRQGANLTIPVKRPGADIFYAAAMGGNLDLLRICLEHGARADYTALSGLSPLTGVVIAPFGSRDWNTAEFLIQNGADVNRRDESGWTPLHVMAAAHLLYFDRLGMERLLRAGADRDARDKDGLLPLHYAAARNNRRAMAVLMEAR